MKITKNQLTKITNAFYYFGREMLNWIINNWYSFLKGINIDNSNIDKELLIHIANRYYLGDSINLILKSVNKKLEEKN